MNKIKLYDILKIFLIFSCLLVLRVDLIFIPNEKASINLLRGIVFLLAILSIFLIFNNINFFRQKEYEFAIKYIFMASFILVFFMWYTKKLYGYTWYQTISLSMHYLFIYEAIAIIYMLKTSLEISKDVINSVIKVSIIFMMIRFIAWFSYNYLSLNIFSNFATEYQGWARNGVFRVTGGQLFGVTYIFLIKKLIDNKKRKIRFKIGHYDINMYLFLIVFMIIYSTFVVQSRYISAVMIITLLCSYYFTREKYQTKLGVVLICVASVIFLIFAGAFDSFISSFSLDGKYGLSTLARIDGINHFYKIFKNQGHNIGLGFLTNGYGTEKLFYRTSWLNYYLEDLGIIGAFYRFGYFSILIYGFLFYKAIYETVRCYKNKNENISLILPMTIYMILSCLLVNIYDAQNAYCVPFYIAIVSFVSSQNKK